MYAPLKRPSGKWKWYRCHHIYTISLILLALCLVVLLINIHELHLMQSEHLAIHKEPVVEAQFYAKSEQRPIVWVSGRKVRLKQVLFMLFDSDVRLHIDKQLACFVIAYIISYMMNYKKH